LGIDKQEVVNPFRDEIPFVRRLLSQVVSGQVMPPSDSATTIKIANRCTARKIGFLIHFHFASTPISVSRKPTITKATYPKWTTTVQSAAIR
jgi:hypothetical protein